MEGRSHGHVFQEQQKCYPVHIYAPIFTIRQYQHKTGQRLSVQGSDQIGDLWCLDF